MNVPARPASQAHSSSRVIAAVAVGNCLELYDFALFGFFSVVLAKVFFPAGAQMTSLMLALATFGVGFVTRPLGGVLFGAYADRRGRRPAIVMTMALMSLGTVIVAFCPSYASIGRWAPAILVLGRLIQGLGIGGEVGPTAALLLDVSKGRRTVTHVSVFMASQGFAALLGALTGAALNAVFAPDVIEAWAWRLPFALGLLVAPVGFYLRIALREPDFAYPPSETPLRTVFMENRRQLASGVLLFLSGTASTYVVMFYMPTYLVGIIGRPPSVAYLAGAVAGMVMTIGSIVGGLIADRFSMRKPLVLIGAFGSAVSILPAFRSFQIDQPLILVLVVVGWLAALNSLQAGSVLALILESFPAHVRATGLSLVYSSGVVVGGFAQLAVTNAIVLTGDRTAPAYYVMICASLTLLALPWVGRATDRTST